MRVVQINLQPHFGGGEVYTAFLTRALSALGVPSRLIVHPRADFWQRLSLASDTELIPAWTDAVATAVPEKPCWILGHGPVPREILARGRDLCTAVVHMPVQGRNPASLQGHHMLFPVSGWVQRGLIEAGLPVWQEPLYGVAEVTRREARGPIRRASCYDWDRRKLRDRLLGYIEPFWEAFLHHPVYQRRPGITLAIVSRITPIKQFPLLFSILAPVLARQPGISLEVFGAGGYASVRDLRRALRPLADRTRFWGMQANIAEVYAGVDYLLTGLPEKEALGLNVIEAQACGTPVLAPDAPPFNETIRDGVTGRLYRDPRTDGGADFARVLREAVEAPMRIDPVAAQPHLARFSFEVFVARLQSVVAWAGEWRP